MADVHINITANDKNKMKECVFDMPIEKESEPWIWFGSDTATYNSTYSADGGVGVTQNYAVWLVVERD